jgi:iron complex outermembrane receptor protein
MSFIHARAPAALLLAALPCVLHAQSSPSAQPSIADPAAPDITITGTREAGRYDARDSSAALKSDTPLLLTPVAVQVIPGQLLEDRQLRTTVEAIRNSSGIQVGAYQFYDQFLVRGFDSGYGTVFRNGLQLRGINEAVNTAFTDHIEVVKGPASMLYGRIEPGGFVNVVTRKPEDSAHYAVDLAAGSWNALRTTVDATGPVSGAHGLAYRFIADLDQADTWVDNAHRRNRALAATLAWGSGSRFSGSLQLEHYDYRSTWLDASVPVVGDRPAPLPRNFSIIYPQSWSDFPYRVNRWLFAADWSYALTPDWKLSQRLHVVRSNEDQSGVYANDFDGNSQFTSVRFTHTGPDWMRPAFGANLDLAGRFRTGGVEHRLLVGVDWARFADDTPGSTGNIDGAAPLDIHAPVYALDTSLVRALANADSGNVIWRDESRDAGVYLQDQLRLAARWDLLVGGRYDHATDAYASTYGTRSSDCYPHCTALPMPTFSTDNAFSPRAGLLYRLADTASLYASYARSFGASNGPDENGNPLASQVGTQYELGAKATFLDGALSGSATLFTLTKTNIPQYDPVEFFPHLVGAARSRGLELDLAGRIGRHVSIVANYTYDQAIVTEDPYGGTVGNRFMGVAPQVLNLWGKYDSTSGGAGGWSAGLGGYFSGQREGDDANSWQMPGYARFDAMVAWRHAFGGSQLALQLNVNNLLDASYFDHGSYGMAAYGAPRSWTATLRLEL